VYVYLPKDIWYDFYNKTAILSNGNHFVITAPADTIPLLVRGGYILPTQMPALTTTLRYIICNTYLFIFYLLIVFANVFYLFHNL